MRSWWIAFTVYVTIAVPSYISAFAVRQTDFHRECVDLQCPETAFDNGVKNLIDEDSLSTEQCLDCNQCTASGYSVCMRIRPNRADRLVDGRTACSCAHTVPVNCHDRLGETRHPANISMKTYSMCYMSALQAPPRPLGVNEGKSVIFTIEPFWLEPYWRELVFDNLTFHYDFPVKAPEHCEGSVVTSDDGKHLCNNAISLNITVGGVVADEEPEDIEYEHSENYDQYDDDLPEEVEIDRDIFAGAPEVQVYYLVDVNRPRQLEIKGGASTIRDTKTSVESEILKYDLTAGYQPAEDLPAVPVPQEEDEDVSEEQGGTEFFVDDKPSKNKQNDAEPNEVHAEIEKVAVKSSEVKTSTEHENEEEDEEEDEDNEATTAAISAEEKETPEKEDNEEEEEERKDHEEEKEDEVTETDGSHETEHHADTADKEKTNSAENATEDEEKTKEAEHEHEEESNEKDDQNADDSGEDDEETESDEDLSFTERIVKDKGMLARWVFGITIAVCLVFILCVCTFRRRCCRQKDNSKTLAGHRYSSVNNQPLVIPPEKERLHQ